VRFRRRKPSELERAQAAERRRLNPPVPLGRRMLAFVPLVVELAAVAAVVAGIAMIFRPAAWIVAGLALIGCVEFVGWQQRRAKRAETAARAAALMSRGDLYS